MTCIPITWCSHHYPWKYGEWHSVMCCIRLAPNITLCIQERKVNCFATFFCSTTLVPCCKQGAYFGIFVFWKGFLLFTLSFSSVLWSNYNVVDPSSVFSYHSHWTLTVLKLQLASWWNPWSLSFLPGNWVRKGDCIFVVTGCIDTPSKV